MLLNPFMEGLDQVEDDEHPRCPSTLTICGIVGKIEVAKVVSMNKETVRQILHDQWSMRKVSTKMFLKILTKEQKDNHKNIYSAIME
jgi:hypothetical protein